MMVVHPTATATANPTHGARWLLPTLLCAATLAACGCVSHRMYRESSIVERSAYSLAFVEFDDHGEFWSLNQVHKLQKLLQRASQHEQGAVVVVFAHGWNNDASPRNEIKGTLAGFERTLEGVSARARVRSPDRPVIGIYLAWRGQSLHGPLKYLTFFSRQRAAARVAGPQGMAMLGQILLDTKRNPRSKLIILGHSFGGQIVERLVQQAVSTGVYYFSLLGQGPLPPTEDLTVLLNPASPATNAKQVIDLLRWQQVDFERRSADGTRWRAPLLVSITSTSDVATRVAYAAGSVMGLLTHRFREYGPEFCSPIDNQRRFYTHTAGHTPVLHSHTVRVGPLRPGQEPFVPLEDGFVVAGSDVSIEVRQRPGAYNDTPYWIMSVPPEVMDGHSDTWNPNLVALVNGILTASGALEPGTEVFLVRKEGFVPVLLWPQRAAAAWLVSRSRRIYGMADGQAGPALVGCMPEGIDLANVIGHSTARQSLVLVQWRPDTADADRQKTEIAEIRLGPGGFREVATTSVRSEERFAQAAVDRQRRTVYLATAERLFAAPYGPRSTHPQEVAELNLAGGPAAMAFDAARQRLAIVDSENGTLLDIDLAVSPPRTHVIDHDLASPAAAAIEPASGTLYVVDRGSRSLLRFRRSAVGYSAREPLVQGTPLREPSLLSLAADGSICVGDAALRKVFVFDPEGTLLHTFDAALDLP